MKVIFIFSVGAPMTRIPLLLVLAACQGAPVTDSSVYAFERDGVSTVSYSGQTFRHLLMADLDDYLDGLTASLESGDLEPGDVTADVSFYLEFDSSLAGDLPHGFESSLPLDQLTYDDLASGKYLTEKLAGNDSVTDYRDWTTELVGWPGVTGAEALVQTWVGRIDAQASTWNAAPTTAPDGSRAPSAVITPEGQDLKVLLRTFLLGGIAYAQATDDYLDDDTDGKGLLADHAAPAEGKAYTELEHAWDEAFGYFGAAVTAGSWTAAEVAEGVRDVDGSDSLDLMTEVCWGDSATAASREASAVAPDALFTEVWAELHAGRALLAATDGPLSPDDLDALTTHRDQAVLAWERAIVATVIHALNGTLAQNQAIGTADYDFALHAEHFSRMKGHALSLQFNPRSQLSEAEFTQLMQLMDIAPALETSSAGAYTVQLREARVLLGETYGFAAANLGDDDGQNGW
jgi:hypothetical protein